MDFKDVYAHKKNSEPSEKTPTSQFTLAVELLLLAFIHMFISLQFVLAYFMIDKLGGNIYMNGIVLSISEGLTGFVAGIAMSYMTDLAVVRISAVVCIVFNLVYYYCLGDDNHLLQYVVLFLAIFGQYAPLGVSYMI